VAGFAKREQSGGKKNPATTRLVMGQYAKPQTISAALACGDPKALEARARRALIAQIDELLDSLGQTDSGTLRQP
jgi:hypothetical protein